MDWQPISTAPRNGTHVILCKRRRTDGSYEVGEGFYDDWAKAWAWADERMTHPDLWQPMPEPPADADFAAMVQEAAP
ncbi:hypothetical protein [Roseomonas chloroacetimidivorans]|uniref:hypothetical protein n=1 Tax=Roseomonas chloroacetimidivorans TaxID=1766656 RepID=UPI003C72EF77